MDGARRVTAAALRAPFTRRAWRELAYCAADAVAGLVCLALITAVMVPALVLTVSLVGTAIGLVLITFALRTARGTGSWNRGLLRWATGVPVPRPAPPALRSTGLLGWLDSRLRDRDGWRAVAYGALKLPLGCGQGFAALLAGLGLADVVYPVIWVGFHNGPHLSPLPVLQPFPWWHPEAASLPGTWLAVPVGAVSVLAGVWLARGATAVDLRLARALLGPSRVSELERTRALAVEDTAITLRRVERDLHDGAQVRLAAVTLNLGMALEKTSDETVRDLLSAAQDGVAAALADLRRIVRGIHPPVLDAGLSEAIASLAASSPLPVSADVDVPRRPAPAIETIAYFCVAELLANAIKHAAAGQVQITVYAHRTGVLLVRVTDDGTGGADPARGSGLDGLRQRVSTVDGSLRVSSPVGGPTTVTVELPMRVKT